VREVHPVDQMDMHTKIGDMNFLHPDKHFTNYLEVAGIFEQCPIPTEAIKYTTLNQG